MSILILLKSSFSFNKEEFLLVPPSATCRENCQLPLISEKLQRVPELQWCWGSACPFLLGMRCTRALLHPCWPVLAWGSRRWRSGCVASSLGRFATWAKEGSTCAVQWPGLLSGQWNLFKLFGLAVLFLQESNKTTSESRTSCILGERGRK